MWLIVIAICVASVVAALGVWSTKLRNETPIERAERLADEGDFAGAERVYWSILDRGPIEMETLLDFIDNHVDLLEHRFHVLRDPRIPGGAIRTADILARLDRDDVSETTRILGRFWLTVRLHPRMANVAAVEALADRPKPAAWANHLLGEAALDRNDPGDAARRFEREWRAFPDEAAADLDLAVSLWADHGAWDEIRRIVREPGARAALRMSTRLDVAIHEHDWPTVLALLWPVGFVGVGRWPWALAILAGILWFAIGARMGRIGDEVKGRRTLYIAAFVLGVFSVYPTLVTIVLEEELLHLTQVGEPIRDAVFFVFGVGLREELWKLVFFLPLLPILRRRGSRVEALVCGAFVGLGFAAEENVGYFASYALSAAIERFLTANFLHMALTALVCVALFDGNRAREGSIGHFHVAFPLAVFIHGAYDFFLSSPQLGDYSLLAIGIFVLLAHRFLREIVFMLADDEREDILRLFVISLFVLSGVSYVYATSFVGPTLALGVIASGFLGVIVLVIMFVRELGRA